MKTQSNITIEEIKIRRLANHFLLSPGEPVSVAKALCGIQAQFHNYAMHALKIRCIPGYETEVFQNFVKCWTLRGTMHAIPKKDLPLYLPAGDAKDFRRNVWGKPSFWNHRPGWALSSERQAELSQIVLTALNQGDKTREALKEICRQNGMTPEEEESMFHPWGGGVRELCERGFMAYSMQKEKVLSLTPSFTPLPKVDAELELARRYFTYYGPATIHDAMYFFHATAGKVKAWMQQLPISSFSAMGREYYQIERGISYPAETPSCIFLAGFDPLTLGYEKKESLFWDQNNMRDIFNLAGIVSPVLLLRGQAAAKWKMDARMRLVITPFMPLSAADQRVIEEKAEAIFGKIRSVLYE